MILFYFTCLLVVVWRPYKRISMVVWRPYKRISMVVWRPYKVQGACRSDPSNAEIWQVRIAAESKRRRVGGASAGNAETNARCAVPPLAIFSQNKCH
jgi:hypothetical protein